MNNDNLEPGVYWYHRPSWDTPVKVRLIVKKNEKFIVFREGYIPTRLRNCPADAVLRPLTPANKAREIKLDNS